MPNKKLRAKQRNRLVSQGTIGLSKKKSSLVKETLQKLVKKSQEGLREEESDVDEVKPPQTSRVVIEQKSTKKTKPIVDKISKKNKYFFLAHPDKKEKVENLNELSGKFVLEKEVVEKVGQNLIEAPQEASNTSKKLLDKSDKRQSLWIIEPCTSSEEDEQNVKTKAKKLKTKPEIKLDRINFEKSSTKLADGTIVETFKAIEEPLEDEVNKSDEELVDEETQVEETIDEKVKDSSQNPLVQKLNASRFRYLNEMLYKNSSDENFSYFKEDKNAFKVYHEGFEAQAHKWPINPLDEIIKSIKNKSSNLIVADFGCGTARLAQSIKNKVHSFDLVASNELVTACDMKNVPLTDKSCDIVVFCLSLMGNNVIDFLYEAHRILKLNGTLKIAEVTSRFKDINGFVRAIESIGFKCTLKETKEEKKYFYFFDFVKNKNDALKNIKLNKIELQPCLYKKR